MAFRLASWLVAVVLVVGAPCGQARAEAPGLANGRAHYLGARFEEAERAFEGVVQDGSSSRADLVEAFRYLSVLRLVRGMRGDAEEAAVRAVSLDRGLTPPDGAPPAAAELFDAVRERVPAGGLSCSLDLPPRPIASTPVGARVRVVGDLGGLVATAALTCAGRELRGTPERSGEGVAVAQIAVDGGPAGRRTECVARVLTEANIVLARSSGNFVARDPDAGGAGGRVSVVGGGAGDGEASGGGGGGFPWVWVGVGAGVAVAGAVVAAILLSSGSDEAYLGPVTIQSD